MNILLDTQVMLWWLEDSPRLGKRVRAEITAGSNQIFISSLSIFECAAKERIKKLKVSTTVVVNSLAVERFRQLVYDFFSAQKLAEVPLQTWKDPFDFGLIAQAAAKHLILVTSDQNILDMNWPELDVLDATK